MNFPIRGDQLIIEMLLEVYQQYNERFFNGFFVFMNDYRILDDEYISIEDLNDRISGYEAWYNDMNSFGEYDDLIASSYRNVRRSIHEIKDSITNQAIRFNKRRLFKTIHNELIAAAMHPNRIQKQLDQFDDIEDFFEAIGC